jgi:hypothetical protein
LLPIATRRAQQIPRITARAAHSPPGSVNRALTIKASGGFPPGVDNQ